MAPTSVKSNDAKAAARAAAQARIRAASARHRSPEAWAHAIAAGDRDALSQGITLVESRSAQDRPLAEALLTAALSLPSPAAAARIGITGIPGVGKSTFIERLGQTLIAAGHRVAVLAVDPTSQRSHGSLLGDKTRMEHLVRETDAFVRPSPASDALGGVNRATSEAMVLCELAGFDRILVETVGVGQSETAVRQMTDIFVLLLISGAGDDLQGIKRGIMEMADLVIINKADGPLVHAAEQTAKECASALHLMPPHPHGEPVEVLLASGLEGHGLETVIGQLERLQAAFEASGWWAAQRTDQLQQRFNALVRDRVLEEALGRTGAQSLWQRLQTEVLHRQISPYAAARIFVNNVDSSK
jgi:LAO/AO transport system kinase